MWNIVRQYKFLIFKAMQMYWGGIKNDLNNIDDVSAGTAVNIYECITLGNWQPRANDPSTGNLS